MNNQPTIEAFNSFYRQGMELYKAGQLADARAALLKAAELANKISVGATSYDVRMEYHRQAAKILDFVKGPCTHPAPKPVPAAKTEEKPSEIKPEKKGAITFADVAGLEDVKEQIRYKVLEPLKNPELAAMYKIEPGAKILLYGPPGTGKTFIARAIAGEVDAEFYAVNCQDLISNFGNAMFLIFMIVGGAMVIPASMGLFARLFGQGDDAHGGGSFLRSAYYGSRFASLAAFGVVGGLLKGSVRAGKRIVNRARSKKSDGGDSDSGSSSDGGDKYTETPAAADESGGTDTAGSESGS